MSEMIIHKKHVMAVLENLTDAAIKHGHDLWLEDWRESKGPLYIVMMNKNQDFISRKEVGGRIEARLTRKALRWIKSTHTGNRHQAMNVAYHLVSIDKPQEEPK